MSTRRSSRHAFLDPKALDLAATEIVSHLPKAVAVGGYAMHLYGSDRLTGDLDVVVARAGDIPVEWRATLKPLAFGGVRTRSTRGVPIDVIARTDDYAALYREAHRTATRMARVPIPVVRIEYLAVMKMASGRPKDEGDLTFLLGKMTLSEKKTSRVLVRKYLGLYAQEEWDLAVDEAEWRKERDQPRRRRR